MLISIVTALLAWDVNYAPQLPPIQILSKLVLFEKITIFLICIFRQVLKISKVQQIAKLGRGGGRGPGDDKFAEPLLRKTVFRNKHLESF